MYNIKLYNKISQYGLNTFDKDKYNYGEDLENYDAIVVRSFKLHETEFPKSLKCIARAGAGVNNIPLDKCSEQGIVVFNTPGANANAVKELVICALIMSSRKIYQGIEWTKTLLNSQDIPSIAEKGKANFAGPEIDSKRLGVIGLGAIGVKVANAAIALGMDVFGYDPFLSVEGALSLSRSVKHITNLNEIFANCDYITLHVPLLENTNQMINDETIKMMKDGVRIINIARGELVDENAMIRALESKKVSCYVSDFASKEMLQQENAIVMPHIGASTPESEDNCAKMAVKEVMDYLETGTIRNSVNFPNLKVPREAGIRLCMIHKNIPNMIASISSVVSKQGINIENMGNRSKGNFAYTIMDTDTEVTQSTINAIKSIDGMISVRVII